MTKFKALLSCTVLSAAVSLSSGVALADQVTLRDVSGDTELTGELIAYDGMTYTIRTSLGELTLEASRSVCDGAGCPAILSETTNLVVAGSGTVTEHLIPHLAKAYFGDISAKMERDDATKGMTYLEIDRLNTSNLLMTMVHSNSSMGIKELMGGELHAAFTTRPVNKVERALAIEAGLSDLRTEKQESVVAYDGLLVVTHPSNPIKAMAEKDIARVFSGDIVNWSAFEHQDGQINIYMREPESNSRELLQQVLLEPHKGNLKVGVTILDSDAAIAEAVLQDPNAIGLTSFVHRAGINALEIEGVCGIRVPATEFTIKTGEYPLSRPVYFYHNSNVAHDGLMGFAEFVSSAEAQSVIESAGFVDRTIMSEPLNGQGLRVANTIMSNEATENIVGTRSMLKRMSHSERLSTTIRFDNGSTDLDATDYEDLEHLVELITSEEYEGADFYFMGFSDSIGRADLNQFLALQRAEIVRQALVSRYPELSDRIKARSVGYGELSPLACNETRPGREVNRRVEVWVEKPMTMASG